MSVETRVWLSKQNTPQLWTDRRTVSTLPTPGCTDKTENTGMDFSQNSVQWIRAPPLHTHTHAHTCAEHMLPPLQIFDCSVCNYLKLGLLLWDTSRYLWGQEFWFQNNIWNPNESGDCTFGFYGNTLYLCSRCLYISRNTSLQARGAACAAVNTCGFQGSINTTSHVDGGSRKTEREWEKGGKILEQADALRQWKRGN